MQVAAAHGVKETQRVLAGGDTEDGLSAQRFKGLDDEVPRRCAGWCPWWGGGCAGIEINHRWSPAVAVACASSAMRAPSACCA